IGGTRELITGRSHLNICPYLSIQCGITGCKAFIRQEEQESHNTCVLSDHLHVAVQKLSLLEKAAETSWKVPFTQLKSQNSTWYSPGFYTSPGGYKIKLNVDCNGYSIALGTHVTCHIYLMEG
uniref:TRAF1-6 MATH domain-containing protein n=1 Tax=Amphimedon queenslandica TaxID=400682 RepID=A0A1X7VG40_AMPQE